MLVNNAGANVRKLAVDVTAQEWDAVMAVNIRGTFFLTQQVGRHLIAAGRGGCIVNIASTHALVGTAERSTYGISKAALVQMTRMLAVEWAGTASASMPSRRVGSTRRRRHARQGDGRDYMAAMLTRIPLRRLAGVEEVAASVAYLASPRRRVDDRPGSGARWRADVGGSSPAARFAGERRQSRDRGRKLLRGRFAERQQRRAELAAIAAHGAHGGLEGGDAAGFDDLPQRGNVFLLGATLEQLSAAQIEQLPRQLRCDAGKRGKYSAGADGAAETINSVPDMSRKSGRTRAVRSRARS